MTKALELVMRHIYLKQNITEYTQMRKKDKKFCFKDGKVITKNQTLMPCVEILLAIIK